MRLELQKPIYNYYNELFENTKDSTYNLWKNLGPVI